MQLLPDDWSQIIPFETPLLELVARGAILYLAMLMFMRILPRRTGGEAAHMDLLVMLLIAEAAAHSFGEYTTIFDGIVVIATILGLNYLLNLLSFHFPAVERLVSHRPLEIVRDGRPIAANMRHEFLTEEEFETFLRQNGLEDVKKVKLAIIEGKGKVSVIQFEE